MVYVGTLKTVLTKKKDGLKGNFFLVKVKTFKLAWSLYFRVFAVMLVLVASLGTCTIGSIRRMWDWIGDQSTCIEKHLAMTRPFINTDTCSA